MNAKRLEPDSEYAKYDADGDGIVSDEEIAASERLQTLELQNEKADAQRNMCWFALWGMLIYPIGIVVADIIGYETTGQLLADIAPTYFVAISALVASFFGAQAYQKARNGNGSPPKK